MRIMASATWVSCAAVLCIAIGLAAPVAAAADQNDGPALTTTVQVRHTERQAQQMAAQTIVQAREAVQAEIQARKELNQAMRTNNAQTVEQARQRHRVAENHAQAQFVHANGIAQSEVAAMRDRHMDWSQMAQIVGMDPSDLGLSYRGRRGQSRHTEFSQATARDLEFGRSMMHGDSDNYGTTDGMHYGTGSHHSWDGADMMDMHDDSMGGHDDGWRHDGRMGGHDNGSEHDGGGRGGSGGSGGGHGGGHGM